MDPSIAATIVATRYSVEVSSDIGCPVILMRRQGQESARHSCSHDCDGRTLQAPRWQSVCSRGQVFRKNCNNSSANAQQKGRQQAPFLNFIVAAFAASFSKAVSASKTGTTC